MDLHGDISPLIWSSKWLVGISQNFKYCSVEVTPLCLLHTVEAAVKIFRCRRCNIHCSSIRWWTMAFRSLHPVGCYCTQLGADIRRPILSNYLFQGLLLCVSGSCSPSTLVNPFLSQRCRALINPYTPIWSFSLKCVVQKAPSISTDILPSELGVAVHCTDVLCESFQFLCFDFPPSHTYL